MAIKYDVLGRPYEVADEAIPWRPKVDPLDQEIRDHLDGIPSKRATAEQIRSEFNEAVRAEQAAQIRANNRLAGDGFAAAHPEFVDNNYNAKLFLTQLNKLRPDGVFEVSDFEAAYQQLRQRGLLELDSTVVAAQERQAAKRNYETERARIAATRFDEAADYNEMDLDEIKRRANEALRRG